MADLEKIVIDSLAGLSLELVEVERAPRGLLRVYIDRPVGAGAVTVEDCSLVSHQLSHVFTVENIDYDRLEVSSPGLDRTLKSANDFVRFQGQPVRVRLNIAIANRKRFDGVVVSVADDEVVFQVLDGADVDAPRSARGKVKGAAPGGDGAAATTVQVRLAQIEKARLIPQI